MRGERKENTLHVRVTKAERQTIDRLAHESGRKASAVVRDLLQQGLITWQTAANNTTVIR